MRIIMDKIMIDLYCLERFKTSMPIEEYYPKNILEHINK